MANRPDTTSLPIIFLAFANDRDDPARYLRTLPAEARQVRTALDQSVRAGHCELIERPNATLTEIFDVFQDARYRERIAIFHYAGHADSFQLLFESVEGKPAPADATAFAAFLGRQARAGLHLVFLNGCSTQQQVRALLDAGIAAVVATSQDITDRVATEFATRFYTGLAGGAALGAAFGAAEAAVQAASGNDSRNVKLVGAGIPQSDRWPWDLYVRPGAEEVLDWSLPQAANDPLFPLPPLPRLDLPATPYRHLEWFRREDAEIFFGRGHEIAGLYRCATAAEGDPIILFYGQSGVGKSSVLAAGLLPRLEGSHLVRYCRRTQPRGLAGTLADALAAADAGSLADAWRRVEAEADRPLLVVLDQVEELFTRPNAELPDEMERFLDMLASLFADPGRRPQGRLILGFRKEWLAEIEKRLEERRLPRAKVFLERLSQAGIVEVVAGPARALRQLDRYGLTVAVKLPGLIADDLLADRESPVAPMLQILLTGMWEAATARDYDHPAFDQGLYDAYRTKGLRLDHFLTRQLAALAGKQEGTVKSGLALDLLAYHTTPLGTAEQRAIDELEQTYHHQAAALPGLVQECRDLYLLVDPSQNQPDQPAASRLTHDTLAPHVRKRFDESDAPGQRARRILESRVVDWGEGEQGTPLDDADLHVVEAGKDGMRAWNATETRLIEVSRTERERRRRRNRLVRSILIGLVALIAVAAGLAIWQWSEARKQATIASNAQGTAEVRRVEADWAKGTAQAESTRALQAEATAQQSAKAEATAAADAIQKRTEAQAAATAEALARGQAEGSARAAATAAADAKQKQAEAQRQAQIARASQLASQSQYVPKEKPDLALLLLVEAVNSSRTSDGVGGKMRLAVAEQALRERVQELGKESAVLRGHQGRIETLAFSPNGRWLASAVRGWGTDFVPLLWNLSDSTAPPVAFQGHTDYVNDLTFSQDGRQLATASDDTTVRLWNIDDPDADPIVLKGHTAAVWAVAFSPDGAWLATAAGDKTVRLWRVDNLAGQPVILDSGIEHLAVNELTFSPDGKWLACGSWNAKPRLWNMADLAASPYVLAGTARALSFSPNGKWLATGGGDGLVRLWSVQQPPSDPIALIGHLSEINTLAFSPDSKRLATGSEDALALLWDVENRASAPIILGGHEDEVFGVAFSPDGRWLATAGDEDQTVRIWDVADSGNGPVVLRGHSGPVTTVSFSPDGHWLASGSEDATVRLWTTSGQPLVVEACRIAQRNLSWWEWQEYLNNEFYQKTCPEWPLGSAVTEIYLEQARQLAASGSVLAATELYSKVLTLVSELHFDPQTKAKQAASQALVESAVEKVSKDGLDAAARLLQEALKLDPAAITTILRTARSSAQKGEIPEAINRFKLALYLDPSLHIDPETKAKRIAASTKVIEAARGLAEQGDMAGAVTKFEEALALDPDLDIEPAVEAQVAFGRGLAASRAYTQAMTAFAATQMISPTLDITATLPDSEWNGICWNGSLAGAAAAVLTACERAVALAPDDASNRDSRGLARALTGDVQGAIEDFSYYVEWTRANDSDRYARYGKQREQWVAALKAGQDPRQVFDDATLKNLRGE